MVYVALLRGINVGGNNKVDMRQLKNTFEAAGMQNVTTYINTGNVIFRNTVFTPAQLTTMLEGAIERSFGFSVKVLLRDIESIRTVCEALPDDWQNDAAMKCDIMFLWEGYDSESTLASMGMKPDIEDGLYVPGAILWRVDREHVTRSSAMKLVGSEAYKHMTLRNCNTVRKLLERMEAA